MFNQNFIERIVQAIVARLLPHLQNGNAPKTTQKRLLTVKEAAAYLGRSESAVYHLVSRREIPVVRHGRNLRLDVKSLDAWVEGDSV